MVATMETPGLVRPLSPRHHQIMTLVRDGYTNREIASRMHLALPTVKTHLGQIFSRLGAKNRTHAVRLWTQLNDLGQSAD